MACDCKDGNGSLMDNCLGTCQPSKMEQYYSQKLIDCDHGMTKLLGEFRKNLSDIERDVTEAFKDLYLEGFKKGFEMAKEIYE